MLYKYKGKDNIEMLPSYNFEDLGGLEKDLENLLANNLADLYSEDGQLMPIFQERSWQSEPDLCALDRNGNLIIFELKRGAVPGDTTIQVMRYCQDYGQKNYFELADLYKTYTGNDNLLEAHKEAFGLENPLSVEEFNRKQKLVVIGSSSDTYLMDAIDYWRRNGIDIDYIPYRFYKIGGEKYFEFFAKPYDYHINVADRKGILFDTNKTYGPDDIWDMFANSKVSAYGGIKTCVNSFNKGDYVLYYHKGWGVVGAGIVKSSKAKEIPAKEEMYLDVEFLTPRVQNENDLRCISVSELRELLNKNFYWAKTTKVPYLTVDESKKVVELLLKKYQ
ncbi:MULTISPECIES: hypothetical protein [unclassified Blautia]|uniref:hypothetical protein n=1 Tax=unclassified Blautia TaxID=2648079 RepID=UPI003F8A56E4